MTRWPLALVLLLALSLALPAIVLAAPLGPLDVPHVSQWGPGADAYMLDCSCAVSVMMLATYTDQRPAVDECCAAVGGCPVHLMATGDWLGARGLPMTWRWSDPAYERDLIRAGHPLVTILAVGGAYHAVLVVGFDDERGTVWIHDPMGASGPSEWPRWNYDAIQWRDPRNGQAFVQFTMSELPGWSRELGRVVPTGAALRGSWRLIDPRIMEAIQ